MKPCALWLPLSEEPARKGAGFAVGAIDAERERSSDAVGAGHKACGAGESEACLAFCAPISAESGSM